MRLNSGRMKLSSPDDRHSIFPSVTLLDEMVLPWRAADVMENL